MDSTSVNIQVPTDLVKLTVKALKQFGHSPIFELSTGLMKPPVTNILLESVPRGDVSDELNFLEKYSIPYSCDVEGDVNIPEAHYHLRFADDGSPIIKVYNGSINHLEICEIEKILEESENEDEIRSKLSSLIELTVKPDW